MFIMDYRGGGKSVNFGGNVRGMRAEAIEFGIEDITKMLEMSEHELKSNLYTLRHCLGESKGRNGTRTAKNPSFRYTVPTSTREDFDRLYQGNWNPEEDLYQENTGQKVISSRREEEEFRMQMERIKHESRKIPSAQLPETGLVWSEE